MLRDLLTSPAVKSLLAQRAAEAVARAKSFEPRLSGPTRELLSRSYVLRLMQARDAATTQAEKDALTVEIENRLTEARDQAVGPDPVRIMSESAARRRHRLRRWGFM